MRNNVISAVLLVIGFGLFAVSPFLATLLKASDSIGLIALIGLFTLGVGLGIGTINGLWLAAEKRRPEFHGDSF